jgi:hypothetical protein
MPSCSKISQSSMTPPGQPIQAPLLAAITGASALTSPPGERRQLDEPSAFTMRSTGRRFASTSSSAFTSLGFRRRRDLVTSPTLCVPEAPSTGRSGLGGSNDMVVVCRLRWSQPCSTQPEESTTMVASHALNSEPDESGRLSQRDRNILDFERQWWKYAGAKESAVREKFDMSSTRYYQVLNALIDRPEALEHDPLLVRRLRRLRATRQRQRSARRLGFEL